MGILKLKPTCKEYIWGGKRLMEEYHKEFDGEKLAETWELSLHPQGPSIITNGEYAGKTLAEYIQRCGLDVLGRNSRRFQEFPVLIKYIDAASDLSIQVHPNNKYALKKEGQYGKTEMWYIADCKEGAYLYYGFSKKIEKEELVERISNNTLLEVLNKVYVQKGDVIFVEAGTIHAIGKDILVAEIQQNSNVTYRLYDYGRKDKEGHMRDLHIEKALEVTNRIPVIKSKSCSPHLASCDYFNVDKLNLNGELFGQITGTIGKESFLHLLVLEGNGEVSCGKEKIGFQKGDSIFLPAESGEYVLNGNCEILATTIPEKEKSVRVGIDVGGTNTKIGLVDEKQNLFDVLTIPTNAERPWKNVIEDIALNVNTLLEKNEIPIENCVGVGVGIPGTIDKKHGIVKYSNNIPWKEVPFARELENYLKLPVYIANDADCAALGEVKCGAAANAENVVMLTLGTGVGGGVVIHGEIFEGVMPGGCELGHMVVEIQGEPCTCGRRGCLETCVSATAVIRNAKRIMEQYPESIMWEMCGGKAENMIVSYPFIAAKKGDLGAEQVVDQFTKQLSTGIINIVNIFRPEKILLGGGIVDGNFIPIDRIVDHVKTENFGGGCNEMPQICNAVLGNKAGMVGAANLVC